MRIPQIPVRWRLSGSVDMTWEPRISRRESHARLRARDVLRQLAADLIGKDSHRGVTLSYAWLANQFGHFSLGFIPAAVLGYCFPDRLPGLLPALIVGSAWTLFELFNFVVPLLQSRAASAFEPHWRNVASDTLTDVLYFSLGATMAVMALRPGLHSLAVCAALMLALAPLSVYWYGTKIYQQRSALPKQLRLAQWTHPIASQGRAQVADILANPRPGRHLLLSGGRSEAVFDLGLALANELAIRHLSCRFLSAASLKDLLTANLEDDDAGWWWRNVSTLLIDLRGGGVQKRIAMSVADLAQLLTTGANAGENRQALRSRTVIWVLGADVDPGLVDEWKRFLEAFGIGPDDIGAIDPNGSGEDVIVVGKGDQVRQAFHAESFVEWEDALFDC